MNVDNGRILYLDETPGPLKEMMYAHKPEALDLWLWADMNDEERRKSLARADYILVATGRVDETLLDGAHSARFIQKTGVGTDNIDLQETANRGLPVANTPGTNSAGVAELTILLMLALYRKLITLNAAVKRGEWPAWIFRTSSFEMAGKVHGLVGFGNIAREVARRSRAFGTEILYFDPIRANAEEEEELAARFVPLEDIFRRSDIISLHAPLTPETKHLVGRQELAKMKAEAILINVARGGIVDEPALLDALREERIAGAALDVWEREPVDPDNALLQLDNVVATPHVGAGTRDTLSRVLCTAFANIERVSRGEPPHNVVNGVTMDKNIREEPEK